jgi:glycerol-3-phosphate dehydrogenase
VHNNPRINLALILTVTAIEHGTVAINSTKFTELQEDAEGKLIGATVQDTTTRAEFTARAWG